MMRSKNVKKKRHGTIKKRKDANIYANHIQPALKYSSEVLPLHKKDVGILSFLERKIVETDNGQNVRQNTELYDINRLPDVIRVDDLAEYDGLDRCINGQRTVEGKRVR